MDIAEPNITLRPRVVVLGAGFGGLTFCQKFSAPAQVIVVDRQNHHLFQPLLYQVATAALSAPDIAAPVRSVLARHRNIEVIMDEAVRVDLAGKKVELARDEPLSYDYLVIAVGGLTSYFGHDEWAQHALGLKTIDDAMAIRRRILLSFERAETCEDPDERRRLMTIVVIGGGPTGVELAGACAELTRRVFKRDFRHIDTSQAKVILIEAGDRVLDHFPPELSASALEQLQELGVEVWTNSKAKTITAGRVEIEGRAIEAENILWGGGVSAHPLTQTLGIQLGPGGRIPVEPDLSIPGYPTAFALGDAVTLVEAKGRLVPGIAPAAMQMGKHIARIIADEIAHGPREPSARPAFRYWDRGTMATIGRSRAVAWIHRLRFSGYFAWVTWLFVHLLFLIGFRNKLAVLLQWSYAYFTFRRGARIVFGMPTPQTGAVETQPRQATKTAEPQ